MVGMHTVFLLPADDSHLLFDGVMMNVDGSGVDIVWIQMATLILRVIRNISMFNAYEIARNMLKSSSNDTTICFVWRDRSRLCPDYAFLLVWSRP